MSEKTQSEQGMSPALFQRKGVPPIGSLIPITLQHVLACFAGVITPALIMAKTCRLGDAETTDIVQVALLLSALDTILQQFPLFGKFGAGLPIMTGISFAYLPAFKTMGTSLGGLGMGTNDIFGYLMGAEIVGGIVAILFGTFYHKVKGLFPPLVTGTVIFTIGVSLYPTAINYLAGGGATAPGFGSPANWAVGLITFALVFALSNFGKGIFKLGAIFFGIIIGTLVAIPFGLVSTAGLAGAAPVAIPKFLPFVPRFSLPVCLTIAVIYIMGNVQLIGDLSAAVSGSMDRMPTEKELGGAIRAQGLVSLVSSLFGGLPTSAFGQNVGIITSTRVVNRWVFAAAGAIFAIVGLSPWLSAVLNMIPQAVIGGSTIGVFGTITLNGIRMVINNGGFTPRASTVFGLSVAFGLGISMVGPSVFATGPGMLPDWVQTIFGTSAITPCAVVTIILNLILPKEQPSKPVAAASGAAKE